VSGVAPSYRTLGREDFEGLLEMWNASAPFDPLTPELLEEKTWSDPGFETELARVCEVNGAIAGFAMAVLRETGGGPRGVIKLLAVAEAHRRRGIGRRLLATLEEELRSRGVHTLRVCESPPNYLAPGVDARCDSANGFFEKHGYRPAGTACNMSVNLLDRPFPFEQEERALAVHGVECRRAQAADRGDLNGLLEAHWPSWREEVAVSLQNVPPALHIALRGGGVVGFAAWDANNRGTGWFGPMGTAPGLRGLGIGRVLLLRCLADMKAAGHPSAVIPWVEPVEFYEKVAGAVVSRTFNRYEKVLAP
jgi:GNAT superfamily N-acetyltransferase